ncbi:MAG: hypothetical protein ABDK94_00050 [Atribacterota bacterium]
MKKVQWLKFALMFLVVAITIGTIGYAGASVRKLPTFNLYTLQGEEQRIPLSSWSLLYFFSPDCFSCLNTVLQFQNKLKGNDTLLFFPICSECDWRALQNIHESLPFEMKIYYLAPRDRVILGIWNTPSLFLLSPTGRVVQRWDKNVSYEKIAQALSVLMEKKVASQKKTQSSCTENICE